MIVSVLCVLCIGFVLVFVCHVFHGCDGDWFPSCLFCCFSNFVDGFCGVELVVVDFSGF